MNIYYIIFKLNKIEIKLQDELENSKIIGNDFIKESQIKKWINHPYKKISFQLLFRMTRDGSNCSDFHHHCDNKGPTLTLVQTTKNFKFGGYTPFSWQSEEGNPPEDDFNTFIFSLNLMKKFNKIREGPSLYFSKNFGPCFGNGGTDFYLDRNLNFGYTVKGNFLNNFELTGGEKDEFKVLELEIYKVNFY